MKLRLFLKGIAKVNIDLTERRKQSNVYNIFQLCSILYRHDLSKQQ